MLLKALILYILKCIVLTNSTIKINTPLGEILGSTELKSRLGKTINSFRGIRFAEAPINALRFQPPVPTGNWSGVYNATVDRAACPQLPPEGITIPISEDCLFLNIYTTKLPSSRKNVKRPVLIYIHGGAYLIGTARSDIGGPQFLLDHDIVLVTLNYRLGALGFISLGKVVPGNNGLKDQVVALRWIKKYIQAFGGDPNSITLSGGSAGGSSANYHMVSPMSRGLFHKAIISCFSAVNPAESMVNQNRLAQKQAQFVGCPDDTPEHILQCLQTKTADEIVATLPLFLEFDKNPILIYSPTIEKDYGQERFIIEHPIKSIMENRFEEVPFLAGVTRDEFALLALGILQNQTLLQELNDDFEKWAPVIFCYERDTEYSKNISRSIRQFYFGGGPITLFSAFSLGKAFADGLTGFSVNRAVDLISSKSKSSVFYYEFTYQRLNQIAVSHTEDQLYLFYISVQNNILNPRIIKIMTSYWANFAKHGNPNVRKIGYPVWKPYNVKTKKYMDIGRILTLRDHLFENRYAFWRRTFPIEIYL